MACDAFAHYVSRERFAGAARIPNRRTFVRLFGHVRERLADLLTHAERRAIENARWNAYYTRTKPARLKQKKRWRDQLGDAWLESRRQYRARNADHIATRQRERRAADPERYREYDRCKYAKHHERLLEWHRDYYRRNRERILARDRAKRADRRAQRENQPRPATMPAAAMPVTVQRRSALGSGL